MKQVMLFRRDCHTEKEFNIATQYFDVITIRSHCPQNALVIGRYSVLPFYRELERDLDYHNSCLINSYEQHKWVANFDYYEVLEDYTPQTWFDHNFYNCQHEGPFVVKGRTNSRKHAWKDLMFAPTKKDALLIASQLMQDPLICEQGIIYRKYEPLETFERGASGLPFSNEWRYFFYKDEMIARGYYWSIAQKYPTPDKEADNFAQQMAFLISPYINLFVIDIAKTEKGNWIVIELNDAQQSGLSTIPPEIFYSCLKNILTK